MQLSSGEIFAQGPPVRSGLTDKKVGYRRPNLPGCECKNNFESVVNLLRYAFAFDTILCARQVMRINDLREICTRTMSNRV